MTWVHNYIEEYVCPLRNMSVQGKGKDVGRADCAGDVESGCCYVLHPVYRASLQQREQDFDWLCQQLPLARDILHPLYNVVTPFVGFTGNSHKDADDADPTLLLNFGYCRLHLPEYGAAVDLFPGDVVFFNRRKVEHYTTPHPGYAGSHEDRWAVSCFFQKRVHNKVLPLVYLPASQRPICLPELLERCRLLRRWAKRREYAITQKRRLSIHAKRRM